VQSLKNIFILRLVDFVTIPLSKHVFLPQTSSDESLRALLIGVAIFMAGNVHNLH
jgi:hypothetical protein